MWVEFVVGSLLAPRGFSPGTPVFPAPQKPALPNFNSIRNARTHIERAPERPFFLFHVLSNVGRVLYLRNRKYVPCFYRVIETRVTVWENEKCCGNTSGRRVFPQLFRVLPNFHECFYNSIETRSTCFLFLLENNATRKRKTTR